jgi:hypothetical protein
MSGQRKSAFRHFAVRLFAAAAMGIVLIGLPVDVTAAPQEESAATLTGVETAQSKALDEHAKTLFQQYQKLQAKHLELNKELLALSAVPSPKPPAEYQKFVAKWQKIQTEDLASTKESLALLRQVEDEMDEAAKMRANAAVQQRCTEVSSGQSNATADSLASPFLCSAVQSGKIPEGASSACVPFFCERTYQDGLAREFKDVQTRAVQLIGQQDNDGIITAERVHSVFKIDEPITNYFPDPASSDRGGAYATVAHDTQQELASAAFSKIRGYPSSEPLNSSVIERLRDFLAQSVDGIQRSVALVWNLHIEETKWRIQILQTRIVDHQESRYKQILANKDGNYEKAMQKAAASSSNYEDTVDAVEQALDAPTCQAANREEATLLANTVEQVRSDVDQLKLARRRLVRDLRYWQRFVQNSSGKSPAATGSDGAPGAGFAGTGDSTDYVKETFPPLKIEFDFESSTNGAQFLPKGATVWRGASECRAFSYFLTAPIRDPSAIPAIDKAIKQRYTEAEPEHKGGSLGEQRMQLVFKYDFSEDKDIEEGTALGARSGESP